MPDIFVTTLDQVPAGEGRNFEVAGRRIAVFRGMDGAVYGGRRDKYDTLLVLRDGSSRVFRSHS